MASVADVKAPISFENVARLPLPGMAVPAQIAFGPGDRVITYLQDPDLGLNRRLFRLDLADAGASPVEVVVTGVPTSEGSFSLEERLRRERERDVGLGVPSATWAESGDVLMVPLNDGPRILTGLAGTNDESAGDCQIVMVGTRAALDGESAPPIQAPRLSPDGSKVAFVRAGDIFVAPTSGPAEAERLTATAEDGLYNGLAEYVAQEEMNRAHGMWWSPDGELIAYAEVDERKVPTYRIAHQGSGDPHAFEEHRYPFAGGENARVRLGVVSAAGGATVWMHLPPGGAPSSPAVESGGAYLARVHWLPGGGLVAEVQSRDQRKLDLFSFDIATGEATHIYSEECEPWVNLHDDFRALRDGSFLWSSERSGFRHLELRSGEGDLVATLTSGEWAVDNVVGVDEEARIAYFTGTKDGPTEKHLYAVPLGGGGIRRLTQQQGFHEVVIGREGKLFCDVHSSLGSAPTATVRSLEDGSVLRTIFDVEDPRVAELDLSPPQIVTIPASDGTELYGLLFGSSLPTDGQPPHGSPPPLVVTVYGGPKLQYVQNAWRATVMLRSQALARLGCNVLVTDGRGSARRGLRFEAHLARRIGHIEVDDQVAGVRWAIEKGLADPGRVAINGWSYGGYMSLRCLARAPEVFRAAVAGAPVTAWDGYDTHYTERYMGSPLDNRDGYESSSMLHSADAIEGKLLLVHGLIDENVHFRHTARLVDRLTAHRVPYELLLFPDERHLPRRPEDRAYMEERVITFLLAALS